MDYEKKYKEALERAKAVLEIAANKEEAEGYVSTIFPELKESEDERIRKELIKVFSNREKYLIDQSFGDITVSEILTWLEKQGESSDKIHYWTEEEIEPIISDYLRGAEHYGGMIGRLRCLKPKSLEKQRTSYTKSDVDDAYLKGLSDAKNELEKQCKQNYLNYENINIQQKDFAPKPKETVKEAESNLTPLERKVKDILFSFHINADDGISFDGTMAIVHNLITLCQQEQKPAWSEEDEEHYKACLQYFDEVNPDMVYYKDYQWLKSLKQKIGG